MNNKAKNYILGGVVLLLVILTISVSYAYFRARILGNEDALKNKVQAGTLELSFVDNDAISIENRKPGSNASKTFSVTNTSTLDEEFTYNIKLVMTELTFVKRDLKYILEEYTDDSFGTPKEGGIKAEGYINTDSVNEKNEMYLAVDIPRPAKGATHYYKLTVDFQELNIPQDYNQEAIFRGKINVDDEKDMKVYEQAPNAPELYQGMIPVYFNDGKIYIADALKDDWYDYNNHEWANAVLIDNSDLTTKAKFYDGDSLRVNQEVQEEDILQMYVWIPRYRYKLFNVDNETMSEQIIDVEFEKGIETTGNVSCTTASNGKETCKNALNGNWYTHPAFTFGDTELPGFWVGKFEPSNPFDEFGGSTHTDIEEITIIPNKVAITNKTIQMMHTASRKIESTEKYNLNEILVDTHMMKPREWGAVAYLSQSIYGRFNSDKNPIDIGAKIWINNTSAGLGRAWKGGITGCSGTSADADGIENVRACEEGYSWEKLGGNASTTGNSSGVFDMNGGSWDYLMGNTVDENGNFYSSFAGFSEAPDLKYYDIYEYGTSFTDYKRGHLGDSTRETILSEDYVVPEGKEEAELVVSSWYNGSSSFPSNNGSWFRYGGQFDMDKTSSSFEFLNYTGSYDMHGSFRVVLTAQDGAN